MSETLLGSARARAWALRICAALLLAASGLAAGGQARAQTPWRFAGADLSNSHGMLTPTSASQINPTTAGSLKVKWVLNTAGDISATPTVKPGGLYVTDWAGYIYDVNPSTGAVIWSQVLGEYLGNDYSYVLSRNSPAIGADGEVVVGVRSHSGGYVFAFNQKTGAKLWQTLVNANPNTSMLGSPVIYNGIIYVGLASYEEGFTTPPSFRGEMVALNEATGAILWQFYTVPPGYTGGAIPGSNPAIDTYLNTIYFGTGNNYSVPTAVATCLSKYTTTGGLLNTDHADQLACLDVTDYVDSIVALDLTTGAVKWTRRMWGADVWNDFCLTGGSTCPNPHGPDFDFASAPNEFWDAGLPGSTDDYGVTTKRNVLLGAGQKSAYYYGLNPLNGGLFWKTLLGPDPIEWGSSVDLDTGTYVFVPVANNGYVPFTLAGQKGVTSSWSGGALAAVNAVTGKMLWQVPSIGLDLVTGKDARANPSSAFTNFVVFQGFSSGVLAAFDMNTGNKLWSFSTGSSIASSPAIFNDTVYWGTGYAVQGGIAGRKLYAFSVDGK